MEIMDVVSQGEGHPGECATKPLQLRLAVEEPAPLKWVVSAFLQFLLPLIDALYPFKRILLTIYCRLSRPSAILLY